MASKVFTGFDGVWDGDKPALQKCPNCGCQSLSYWFHLWQCENCHQIYEAEYLSPPSNFILTKRFKTRFQTFRVHQIDTNFWLECTDSANQRYQYMLPFFSFEDAVVEAKWFHQEFSGDPLWIPHDWSYVGLGMNRIDLNLQFKMHLGSPSLTLITMNGERLHLFDKDALAVYQLISKETGVQVFNSGFNPEFDRQIFEDVEIDLDDF